MSYVTFPSKKMALGVAIIAVLAVTVASATGIMSPVTMLIGRAVGSLKAAVMGVFGQNKRAA